MNLYTYPLTDFPNGINLDLLGRQIVDAIPAIVPVYLGSTKAIDVSISFDSALSGAEEAELTALVAAHDPTGYSFALNYNQDVYNSSRRLLHNTWYAVRTISGALIYKVEETVYTYDSSGNYVTGENVKTYNPLGAVMSDRSFTFETITNSDGSIFIRKSET